MTSTTHHTRLQKISRWCVRTFHTLGSPQFFFQISQACLPTLTVLTGLLLTVGLTWGLFFAPPDYQQGNSFRIIYIHVPAASLALSIYVIMAVSGAVGWIWKIKLADIAAQVSAPLGAVFTALALITGAIWGKPTWGTWWVWDARLTSMLILLFLYAGVIALRSAFTDRATASKAAGLLSLVGLVNLPIIKYSVDWWYTLHQGATFSLTKKPSMPPEMWIPLLISLLGFYLLLTVWMLVAMQTEIMRRERRTHWLQARLQTNEQTN